MPRPRSQDWPPSPQVGWRPAPRTADSEARKQLFTRAYDELRRIARRELKPSNNLVTDSGIVKPSGIEPGANLSSPARIWTAAAAAPGHMLMPKKSGVTGL